MFDRIKSGAKRAWRPLVITAVCVLSLVVLARFSDFAKSAASAMYLLEEGDVVAEHEEVYVPMELTHLNVFLMNAESELVACENGSEMILNAGVNVSVIYGSNTMVTISEEETLITLFGRLDLHPSSLEMVILTFGENTLTIEIASEYVVYKTTTTYTPHEVIYQYNEDKPDWQEVVIQQGYDGVHSEVYEIVYQDGMEIGRQLIELTDTEPVTAIIEKGTIPNFANNDDPVASITTNEDGTGYITLENGQVITFNQVRTMKGTAYNCDEPGLGTITYTGTTVHWGVVAVDKKVIPLGTKMYIVSNDGYLIYGFAIAEDTGVRGEHVDLYMDSWDDMINFGVRECTVYILD